MKVAIEVVLGVFLVILMSVTSVSYLTASADIRNAQNFHSSVITELEASAFSENVIEECIKNAEENGYIHKKADGSVQSGLVIGPITKHARKVTLTYDYSIPILNKIMEHEIIGYAKSFN